MHKTHSYLIPLNRKTNDCIIWQAWSQGASSLPDYNNFIPNLLLMASSRELPSEYLDLCPVIDDKYRVLFRLGFGRFSKVKLGIQLATKQRVAIKIMNHRLEQSDPDRPSDDSLVDLFLNEIRMATEAKHPHVVEIIDFNVAGVYRGADGRVRRILYYVMRIQQHGELFRVISLTEQFSERTARVIFRQLVSALSAMHARRIAHCDIKSQNVLLDARFNLKVVDFGCARYSFDEHANPIPYENSDAVGSVKCNAPELITNLSKGIYHAEKIDVFAAGCFLFELVMKCEPFKSADIKDEHYSNLVGMDKKKFWDIFNSKLTPSPDFKDLIERMLAVNPKERITLHGIRKHAWTNGERPSKEQYKKEMGSRVKKVMVKVRKEQETEMKQVFMKEKGKKEVQQAETFQLNLRRDLQERIIQLKSQISSKDNSSASHSQSSSLQEYQEEKAPKRAKVEKMRKTPSENNKEKEDQSRNQ